MVPAWLCVLSYSETGPSFRLSREEQLTAEMLNQEVVPLSGLPLSWLRSIATCRGWQDSFRRRDSWNWWGQAGWGPCSFCQECPCLSPVVLNQVIWSLRWHLTRSRDIFDCPNLGGRVLLASGEQRPGILLNILQCTGQLPTRNYPTKNVNSPEIKNTKDNMLRTFNAWRVGVGAKKSSI